MTNAIMVIRFSLEMEFKRITTEIRGGVFGQKERSTKYVSEDGRVEIVPFFTRRSGIRMYANRSKGQSRHVQVKEKWYRILVDGREVRFPGGSHAWRVKDAKADAEAMICPECKDYGMRSAIKRWTKEIGNHWLTKCTACGHEIREAIE